MGRSRMRMRRSKYMREKKSSLNMGNKKEEMKERYTQKFYRSDKKNRLKKKAKMSQRFSRRRRR